MSGFPKLGRPPISDYCVDCFKEGKSPEDCGEKRYGSYCANHYYKRQARSKLRKSMKKEVIRGYWGEIVDDAKIVLVHDCEENIGKVLNRVDDKAQAYAIAFEYDCMRQAIDKGRRITRAEEDVVIAAWNGSRTAEPRTLTPVGPNAKTQPGVSAMEILLPDPDVRRNHRAGLMGGPTTEGEPVFTEYYLEVYGRLPDGNILDRGYEPTLYASDGREVSSEKALAEYEALIKRDRTQRLDYALGDDKEEPPLMNVEDRGYNRSFTDMMGGESE